MQLYTVRVFQLVIRITIPIINGDCGFVNLFNMLSPAKLCRFHSKKISKFFLTFKELHAILLRH